MVLLFIGCIQSCSTEESLLENDSPIKTVTKEEALLFLKQNPINTNTKFLKKESFTLNFNAITQEKITNSDQLITIIPIDNKEKKEYERILFLKIKDTIKSAVFSMYPDENSSSKNFSGKIKITSLNGQFINGFRIKNGHFISRFLKKEPTNYKNKEFSKLIVIDGVEFEELDEVIIINNYHSTPSTIYYMTLFEEWSNYGGNNNDYGMGWNYGGGSGSGENDETDEEIARKISDSIDDSQLDPCTKAIMEKLKNSTVCDIKQILTKLDAKASIYNTTIKSAVAPSGKPAQTVWNSPYNYTIYISSDYTGKTNLFIAASMFHEIVHAYFMSIFDDYHNSNPPNLNSYNDFTYLFDLYVNKKYPNSQAADIHHQQMATDYVDAIARGLQEYQTGIPVPVTSTPNQIYSDMAWGGLSDAPIFNVIYPIGNPNRGRIINRYKAEQQGYTIDSGTPLEQAPLGKPCK